MMSKPMLVTWPFVMLLLDYWPLDRFKRSRAWRLVTEKIPFFILAAAASVVTFVVQKRGGSVIAAEDLPFGVRIGNALIMKNAPARP
jgi:hypothetical protein